MREAPPSRPGAAGGRGRPGDIVRLQRLAGNRAVSRAVAGRRPAPAGRPGPAGVANGPGGAGDRSVIDRELAEVTSAPGVSAARSPSGRNLLVPDAPPPPAPPPPPVPAPQAAPAGSTTATPGLAGGPASGATTGPGLADGPAGGATTGRGLAGGPAAGRGGEEISAALAATTGPGGAAATVASGPGTSVATAASGAGAAPRTGSPAAGPDGAGTTAVTAALREQVAPPAPEQLRAQLPDAPPVDAVEEDLLDQRSAVEKNADAQDRIAGLQPAADRERAGVAADVAQHRDGVQALGRSRTAEVTGRLAAALAGIAERATATRGRLSSTATARKAQLREQTDADVTAVREATTAKVAEAGQALTTRRQSLTGAAEAERTAALAAADAEATRTVTRLEAAAVDCEQAGERQAARYPGEEDSRPQQRDAARQVGRESAADIRSKKAGVGPDLRARASEHGQRVTDYVTTVTRQLDDAQRVLTDQLRDTGRQAETAVRDGLTGALTAVDQRLAADLAAVDATAAAVRDQVRTAAGQVTGALDADTTAATGELTAAGQAVDTELANTATETAQVLTEPEHPFLPGVTQQVTVAHGQLTATGQAARTQLAAAAATADGRFTATAAVFDAAATTATGQLDGQLDQITAGSTAAADRAAAARREAAGTVLGQLRQQHQQVTDGVLAEADRACQAARTELDRMSGEQRRAVTEAGDRAVEEGIRPRTDDVDSRAHEAAEQVDDGFWAGLGRALVQIAVGLVVLVVVALVVAAIAAVFGVLLTAWTAIMIAGAILLTISLVVSLVHRLGQAELSGRPGTAILIALADTLGITGIWESYKGQDIVTGQQLSTGQRTERGVLGTVTLVSLIFGARSALRGPPGGVPFRPVSEVPGWGGLGVFGRAWAGVSGVAAELAGAIGRGIRSLREWWADRGSTPPDQQTPPGQTGGSQRTPPQPGELPPGSIDPATTRAGDFTFTDELGTLGEGNDVPPGATPVRVEAALPDGRFGWLSAAHDPATGQFHTVQIDLSNIPPELRYVETAPGQRVPLSDYLTLRAMRLLNVSLGPLRSVRIHGVENVRSVLQIWRGDPPLRTQVVSGQADAVVRGGGRVVDAQVVPGTGQRMTVARLLAIWEGDTPPPDMVARHDAVLTEFGLDRTTAATTEVTAGFDVDIRLQQPAGAPPVPVVPGGAQDRDAGD